MATLHTPHVATTTAITRTFAPNCAAASSGIFQVSNTDSGTATVTLKGRLSDDHTYAEVKSSRCYAVP